jgi:hypothetical protein
MTLHYIAGLIQPVEGLKRKGWGPPARKEFCLQAVFGLKLQLGSSWVFRLPACPIDLRFASPTIAQANSLTTLSIYIHILLVLFPCKTLI